MAEALPSPEVAVMIAVPFETPVTMPELLTTAIFELSVDHVTALFVAVEGRTVAVSVAVWVL